MTNRALTKHIILRKKLLNFLLNYFSPTNRFIVSLSQNLDLLVAKRQKVLYTKHRKRDLNYISKTQQGNSLKRIA